MRVVGYIRVSSEEQVKEGVSLEMQADKIRAYCSLNDLELMGVIEDRGIRPRIYPAVPGSSEPLGW